MADPKTDPYRKFAFTVEIDGLQVAGFRKVSGLSVDLQPEEYEEGGVNHHVHQLPGQVSYSNLVLEQGLTRSRKLWDWIQGVLSGTVYERGGTSARKNVTVTLRASSTAEANQAWRFESAYPVKWEGPELAADASGSSAIAIQRLELAHRGFERTSR